MGQFTVYKSTDSSAPVLTGQTGKLVDLLDACLVNGWTASVTSITRSGSTATVTTAGNHGLNTGNSTTIAGANETDYNGTFVATVTSATVFTITVANSPTTPATGTITWKKLAAGWTKSFSGTSKAAYRQGNGNQFYIRIRDDGPNVTSTFKEAWCRGYESMSDVDTGTALFPTVAQITNSLVIRKSAAADSTARAWIIVADDRTIHAFISTGDTASVYQAWSYGDIYSYVGSSDGFRTVLIASPTENSGSTANLQIVNANGTGAILTGHFMPRGYLGTGASITVGKHTDNSLNGGGGNLGVSALYSFPNPTDGSLLIAPVWLDDLSTGSKISIRGYLRGIWCCGHATANFTDGDTFSGTGDLAGKSFLIIKSVGNSSATTGFLAVETSNTLSTN